MKWKNKVSSGLLRTDDLPLHKVRVYQNRLAIWRKDGERLSWEELQEVKENIWGDAVAVEIYPKNCDVVNLRPTRHLWKLTQPVEQSVLTECSHIEFLQGGD